MSKIRVLHVVVRLSVGGIEKWLINLLEVYDKSKFQMDICCVGLRPDLGILADQARALGASVYYISLRNFILFLVKFAQLIRRQNYQVLVSHVGPSTPALIAAKLAGVRVRVKMYHNTVFPKAIFKKPLRDFLPKIILILDAWLSTAVIGCSKSTLDNLFPAWRNNRKFKVINYGIPVKKFLQANCRKGIRQELGIPADAPVVGHVGRFDPQKNHETFVDVARLVLNNMPNTHFILVGDGRLRPEVESQVSALGMSENFHFTGVRNDVPELMSAMDVAFYPSLHEGSPVTFIEAQIAGLPIVTGQRPEMKEAICPCVHQFALVNIADHRATAAHLVGLLADPSLRSHIAALSRDWALERYSIERSAQCLETLLYSQLAR